MEIIIYQAMIILNCKVEYTHSEILKELEKTIQGVTEEREKTEEYMQNIAAVILAPGFVNSEKDPDMDLNTLDMIRVESKQGLMRGAYGY